MNDVASTIFLSSGTPCHVPQKNWAPLDRLKFSLLARAGGHKRRKLKSIFIHLCRISVVHVLKLVKLSLTYQKKPIDPITPDGIRAYNYIIHNRYIVHDLVHD